ncbi:hypothetical protein GCM10011342_20980 [Aquisalinus flavus]|uniref:Uncharacterized protein n=1 Tax=Aquisalinus flavus TaxID=1526572 RepID=A0A8J2V6E1_9PROT|nr:hypothetical protein GCM10011342_20980 [Aquisalinus flavus]
MQTRNTGCGTALPAAVSARPQTTPTQPAPVQTQKICSNALETFSFSAVAGFPVKARLI